MARAVIAMFYEWDLRDGRSRSSQRSIALNPNDAESHLFYFWLPRDAAPDGGGAGADRDRRRARSTVGHRHHAGRDPGLDRGSQCGRGDGAPQARSSSIRPSTWRGPSCRRCCSRRASGRPPAPCCPPPDELLPGATESAWPALVRVALGDTAGAQQITRRAAREAGPRRYVAKDLVATVRLALGDVNGALDDLERRRMSKAFSLILVGVYPLFRTLAREPRYPAAACPSRPAARILTQPRRWRAKFSSPAGSNASTVPAHEPHADLLRRYPDQVEHRRPLAPRHVGVSAGLTRQRQSVLPSVPFVPSQQRDLFLVIVPAEHQVGAALDDGALGRLGPREPPAIGDLAAHHVVMQHEHPAVGGRRARERGAGPLQLARQAGDPSR